MAVEGMRVSVWKGGKWRVTDTRVASATGEISKFGPRGVKGGSGHNQGRIDLGEKTQEDMKAKNRSTARTANGFVSHKKSYVEALLKKEAKRDSQIQIEVRNPGLKEGFPSVSFSPSEIQQGVLKFKCALVLQFFGKRPSASSVQHMIASQWNLVGRFSFSEIWDSKHVVILLDSEVDVRKGLDCPIRRIGLTNFRLFRWCLDYDPKRKLRRIWLGMPDLPLFLYDISFVKAIAASFSNFVKLDEASNACNNLKRMRVCVEVKEGASIPGKIWIDLPNNLGYWQEILVEGIWCSECRKLGHEKSFCELKGMDVQVQENRDQGPDSHLPVEHTDDTIVYPNQEFDPNWQVISHRRKKKSKELTINNSLICDASTECRKGGKKAVCSTPDKGDKFMSVEKNATNDATVVISTEFLEGEKDLDDPTDQDKLLDAGDSFLQMLLKDGPLKRNVLYYNEELDIWVSPGGIDYYRKLRNEARKKKRTCDDTGGTMMEKDTIGQQTEGQRVEAECSDNEQSEDISLSSQISPGVVPDSQELSEAGEMPISNVQSSPDISVAVKNVLKGPTNEEDLNPGNSGSPVKARRALFGSGVGAHCGEVFLLNPKKHGLEFSKVLGVFATKEGEAKALQCRREGAGTTKSLEGKIGELSYDLGSKHCPNAGF